MTQSKNQTMPHLRPGENYAIVNGPSKMGLAYSLMDGQKVQIELKVNGSICAFDVVLDGITPESGRRGFMLRGLIGAGGRPFTSWYQATNRSGWLQLGHAVIS